MTEKPPTRLVDAPASMRALQTSAPTMTEQHPTRFASASGPMPPTSRPATTGRHPTAMAADGPGTRPRRVRRLEVERHATTVATALGALRLLLPRQPASGRRAAVPVAAALGALRLLPRPRPPSAGDRARVAAARGTLRLLLRPQPRSAGDRARVATALGALCLLLLLAAPAGAQSAFFDEGNRLYQAGDFEGALDRYQRILDEGLESGELYYNIGNAHFRRGDLAPAILNYERARRLMPGDDDLLANLDLARSMTVDDITPRPRFWLFRAVDWWVGLLPRSALIWLVALAWVTAVAGAAVVALRPAPRLAAWARRAALAAAALTLVLGVNLGVRELGLGAAEEAIVMADEAQVQSAPSDDPALQIFEVHAGTKVVVDRRADDWVEIVLEDGAVGWTRAAQLELVRQ